MEDVLCLFKALSDETRLSILELLEDGGLCVCDITTALERISGGQVTEDKIRLEKFMAAKVNGKACALKVNG